MIGLNFRLVGLIKLILFILVREQMHVNIKQIHSNTMYMLEQAEEINGKESCPVITYSYFRND